jgi:putative heme iron utilization protein
MGTKCNANLVSESSFGHSRFAFSEEATRRNWMRTLDAPGLNKEFELRFGANEVKLGAS